MLPRIMVFPAAPIHQVAGVRRRVQMSQVSSSYMPPYLHSDSQWNFQSHKLSFADGGRVDSIQEHLWNRRVRPRARRNGRTGFLVPHLGVFRQSMPELSTTGWLEDTYKKRITHQEAPPF